MNKSAHFPQRFSVYRGQILSKVDFEKLLKMKGGFISFNNFLSTSKNINVSTIAFADSMPEDSDSVSVLFVMNIDGLCPLIALIDTS